VDDWLNVLEFQPWLEKRICHISKAERAYCAACCDWVTNGKSELSKHKETRKHVKNMANYEETLVTEISTDLNVVEVVKLSHTNHFKVLKMETRLY
jgi:hypothetical protein